MIAINDSKKKDTDVDPISISKNKVSPGYVAWELPSCRPSQIGAMLTR